jgi:hypothetical protein
VREEAEADHCVEALVGERELNHVAYDELAASRVREVGDALLAARRAAEDGYVPAVVRERVRKLPVAAADVQQRRTFEFLVSSC